MRIHWLYRIAGTGLRLALVVLALVAMVNVAVARETYAAWVERLLEQPPEGIEVRNDLETAVLAVTNRYRASKSYPALRPADPVLLKAARAHAMDLLLTSTMGHTSSNGYGFESRMRALHEGQMVLAPMAENAARLRNNSLADDQIAKAFVQQWIKSSGHRKNLINRTYTSVAIGVVRRGNDIYAVQIFSGPKVKTNLFGGSTP